MQCADEPDGTRGKRIVGILVPENMVKGVTENIKKGVPNPDHTLNLTERIVSDPFFKVSRQDPSLIQNKTLIEQMCFSSETGCDNMML